MPSTLQVRTSKHEDGHAEAMTCPECGPGYRCAEHMPQVEPAAPDDCAHEWWGATPPSTILRCLACGTSDIL